MKKSRFTESQIVGILKEGEAGLPVAQLARNHGISAATYYHWKSKYGGASVAELKRLRKLEAENAEHGLPVSRACQAARLSRAAYYRPGIDWRDGITSSSRHCRRSWPKISVGASGSATIGCADRAMAGTTNGSGGCIASSD